jgi:hypothetical protein
MVTVCVLVGPVLALLALEVLDKFAKTGPYCWWVNYEILDCKGAEYPKVGDHGNNVVGIVHVPVAVEIEWFRASGIV